MANTSITTDKKALRRYLEAREKVDSNIQTIHSLASLLAKFQHFEQDRLEIDPVALGLVHQTIEQCALEVWAALDEFLSVRVAREGVEK